MEVYRQSFTGRESAWWDLMMMGNGGKMPQTGV
jgi:hypothetical protein